MKQIKIPYTPRPLQADLHQALWNDDGKRVRFVCLALHRRFGKSVFAIMECITGALTCPLPNPRFFYIAPTAKQARSIAWDYCKEFLRDVPNVRFYETDLRIQFPNGARIQLSGCESFENLRGNYVDGVVLDEWGNMNPQIYKEVLRPALADRLGWVIWLGTPCGLNHFYDTYREAQDKTDSGWLARTYSVNETKLVDQAELDDSRSTMGENEYRQEFLCDWSASSRGSFYGDQMRDARQEGRIMRVPHAKQLPVNVSFDLGMDDATGIWYTQFIRSEIRLIRYEEYTNTPLLDILRDMSRLPYIFGTAILPHDAEVQSFNDGKTRTETVANVGLFEEVEVIPRMKIEDGINAVRLGLPSCYFDAVECQRGIDCLENYRKTYDPKKGIFTNKPVHDRFSNGADSFRYLHTFYSPSMGDLRKRGSIARVSTNEYIKPKVVASKRLLTRQR